MGQSTYLHWQARSSPPADQTRPSRIPLSCSHEPSGNGLLQSFPATSFVGYGTVTSSAEMASPRPTTPLDCKVHRSLLMTRPTMVKQLPLYDSRPRHHHFPGTVQYQRVARRAWAFPLTGPRRWDSVSMLPYPSKMPCLLLACIHRGHVWPTIIKRGFSGFIPRSVRNYRSVLWAYKMDPGTFPNPPPPRYKPSPSHSNLLTKPDNMREQGFVIYSIFVPLTGDHREVKENAFSP